MQYAAVVTDTSGAVVDTTVAWAVLDTSIGSIDQSGLFSALSAGSTNIVAAVGAVTDTASVTVESPPEPEPEPVAVLDSIAITPKDQTIGIGDSLQFQAEVSDTAGILIDTTVTWAVLEDSIGSIDSSGLFICLSEGTTKITALVGAITDTASVTVSSDAPPAEGGGNTVVFQRIGKNGKATNFGKTVQEGETKTLGGIPHPLNFLNGGKLFFPENSLSEDITITIKLPGFAEDKGDAEDVDFGDGIAVALTFEVSVNDSVISPYEFDVPLELTLPYKKGLLDKLGIDPLDLGMFFVSETGALESSGIGNVFVDSETNKIKATVSHFSDLVAAE